MKRHIGIAAILFCVVMTVTCFAEYDNSVIKEVQQALNDAGFNCGTADGIAGKATAGAIMEYQKENGMPEDGEISDELLKSLGIGTPGDAEIAEEDSAKSAAMSVGEGLSVDDLFIPAKFVEAYNRFLLDPTSGQRDEYALSLPDTNVSQFNLRYYSTYSSTILNRTGRGFCLEYDHRDTPGGEVEETAVYSKAIFEFDLYDYRNSGLLTDLTNLGNILQNFLHEPGLQRWFVSAWNPVFFALAKDEVPVLDNFKGENLEFEFHFDEKDREYMYFWMTPVKAD